MDVSNKNFSVRRSRLAQTRKDQFGIDEGLIHELVHSFYGKIQLDPMLGPLFMRVIGTDWGPHLAKMCDFWSSVMLTTGRYKGNPMKAHLRLKAVRPHHFDRWLSLFEQTATEVCSPKAAALFITRAHNISRSLQLGMFFRPQLQAGGAIEKTRSDNNAGQPSTTGIRHQR